MGRILDKKLLVRYVSSVSALCGFIEGISGWIEMEKGSSEELLRRKEFVLEVQKELLISILSDFVD